MLLLQITVLSEFLKYTLEMLIVDLKFSNRLSNFIASTFHYDRIDSTVFNASRPLGKVVEVSGDTRLECVYKYLHPILTLVSYQKIQMQNVN